MKPDYVKVIHLEGTGREAQEKAQADVTTEFMRQDMDPMYRLMINYSTGVGKSKAAIECNIAFQDQVKKGRTFIGCHTAKQKTKLWPAEIAKFGRMHPFTAAVDIECYKSMGKIRGNHYAFVILDEAHHLTHDSLSFFYHNTFDAVILLTATRPKSPVKRQLIQKITGGRRIIIEAEQAIDAGILNDYEVYIIRLQPDDNLANRFRMYKTTNTLYTEWTGYLKKCLMLDQAKRSGNQPRIRQCAIDRKRYLGNLETKTRAAAWVQEQFRRKKERFITIAAGINQAEALSKYTYHSKTSDVYYTAFLNNRIDELVSVNTVKEGENFDNLGRCLIIQADRDAGPFIQIRGRVLRLPPGMISRVYILCVIGTQDEVYIREALADVPKEKINYYDLPQEKYWPQNQHIGL